MSCVFRERAFHGCGRAVLCVGVLGMLFAASARAVSSEDVSCEERATLAIRALQSWYNPQTGLYRTTGWWNSANAVTTLADYSRVSGSKKFDSVFPNAFRAAQKTSAGFINKFYDDEGWWALAWIDVYDLTGDGRYLVTAKSIFANMAGGWDDTCNGGIWWSKDRNYKNAIANELFLSVAAHLAKRAKSARQRKVYFSWATREWRWFLGSGMINADHLVNDGLDAKCANNGKTTWTYNQGVILGGLAELSKVEHDASLLPEARSIAAAVFSAPKLTDAQGILHEPCEPDCGGDGSQFKGIFVRNLQELDEVLPDPHYERFFTANADSIWSGAKAPEYQLG
ncbi:MAG TPA: glycoside hydrolase family 76 protein, partial [Silvibacterium sp.]|nr:glycoside hydrolase family 76 protein [Silvibacterium sp.]